MAFAKCLTLKYISCNWINEHESFLDAGIYLKKLRMVLKIHNLEWTFPFLSKLFNF